MLQGITFLAGLILGIAGLVNMVYMDMEYRKWCEEHGIPKGGYDY